MSQSDTRTGDIPVLAGEDLTGKNGRLVVLTHDGGGQGQGAGAAGGGGDLPRAGDRRGAGRRRSARAVPSGDDRKRDGGGITPGSKTC